ncbi:MAG: DUF721 domain-containing protein [Bacteroidales bacterium]|nr:DUF721 domain-containing protein [Bacteroidales bacterium]
MKRTDPVIFEDVLNEMIEATGMRSKLQQASIEAVWPRVVGGYINSFTGKRFVKDRTFHVYIVSAPIKEQLSFMRDALVKSLNEAVGDDVIDAVIIH